MAAHKLPSHGNLQSPPPTVITTTISSSINHLQIHSSPTTITIFTITEAHITTISPFTNGVVLCRKPNAQQVRLDPLLPCPSPPLLPCFPDHADDALFFAAVLNPRHRRR
jgi:hypothetical protein